MTTKQAVITLKLSKPPATGSENYQYLQQMWKQDQMSPFKDFSRWYNNEDVVPTLEAMQKMIASYHDKDIDMLKLGCTLPNLSNNCLHKPTNANFYPFREGDKKVWKEFGKTSLVVHQSFLHAKQLLMKFSIEGLQTYANLLLGLVPANHIATPCVNSCPMAYSSLRKINITSNNKGFRTNNRSVATYEQAKNFYPKRIVETNGTHTQPLSL